MVGGKPEQVQPCRLIAESARLSKCATSVWPRNYYHARSEGTRVSSFNTPCHPYVQRIRLGWGTRAPRNATCASCPVEVLMLIYFVKKTLWLVCISLLVLYASVCEKISFCKLADLLSTERALLGGIPRKIER